MPKDQWRTAALAATRKAIEAFKTEAPLESERSESKIEQARKIVTALLDAVMDYRPAEGNKPVLVVLEDDEWGWHRKFMQVITGKTFRGRSSPLQVDATGMLTMPAEILLRMATQKGVDCTELAAALGIPALATGAGDVSPGGEERGGRRY